MPPPLPPPTPSLAHALPPFAFLPPKPPYPHPAAATTIAALPCPTAPSHPAREEGGSAYAHFHAVVRSGPFITIRSLLHDIYGYATSRRAALRYTHAQFFHPFRTCLCDVHARALTPRCRLPRRTPRCPALVLPSATCYVPASVTGFIATHHRAFATFPTCNHTDSARRAVPA